VNEHTVWEVFRQERRGQPFEHAGSVVAPDADFAEAWAREQYGRRGEYGNCSLRPRDAIRESIPLGSLSRRGPRGTLAQRRAPSGRPNGRRHRFHHPPDRVFASSLARLKSTRQRHADEP